MGFTLICARKVFDKMSVRSKVSWTVVIVGYARGGDMGEASRLFDNMEEMGVADEEGNGGGGERNYSCGGGGWGVYQKVEEVERASVEPNKEHHSKVR
ncbi:hypothetical protein Fmac_027271 [Flemingia macrophylla]|uniref:Pentatricopeptide repeat-containing protein n=1 Tax=Flemingia macrophylla TaxID=520843 RepID=A0ABD1LHD1_9FABA